MLLADDGVEITSETILADDGVEITWDMILANHVVEIRLLTWHLPGKRNQPTSAPSSVPRHSHPILHGKTSPSHNTVITLAPSFIEKAATCSALILADDGVEITSEKNMVLTLPSVPCFLAGKTDCFHIQTHIMHAHRMNDNAITTIYAWEIKKWRYYIYIKMFPTLSQAHGFNPGRSPHCGFDGLFRSEEHTSELQSP